MRRGKWLFSLCIVEAVMVFSSLVGWVLCPVMVVVIYCGFKWPMNSDSLTD